MRAALSHTLVRLAIPIVIGLGLLAPVALRAQIADPDKPVAAPKPVDAVDALAAWRRLDISRQAVKDQLELCSDDAQRFQTVGRELKPQDGADAGVWTEWAGVLRDAALELQSCLRGYRKQIGLLRADSQALRDVLPAARDAKRMSLGPKQQADAGKAAEDAERDIVNAEQKVAALIEVADQTLAEGRRLLRQAGVAKVDLPGPFRN